MTTTRVQFDKGIENNLPTSGMAEDGHLYFSNDKGNMYLGMPNGSLLPLNRSPYYGTCSTTASTNSKVVTLDVDDDNFYLNAGVMISVKFTNENSILSPTLNVNNTGAIAIKKYGTTAIGNTPNTSWHSGEVISFIYDGNYWMKVGFDISEKADKVSNATNGNFAGLDSTGNLTNSGHNSSELVPSGGTIGQILAKHSNTDNDVEWVTPEETEMSVSINYSDLVALKTGGNLVPGKQYRITDYNTTVSEDLTDVSVAEHQFDIIVTALSETELDHRASAVQHEGETYFSDCDLSKWQLWYDIENDTEKYEWAVGDSSSGNGGAKGSIPEYAPEYIYSDDISSILSNAGLSRALVFQGIETITLKEDVECYIYGTSVQAEPLGYVKLFLQEYPSVSSSTIYGIDSKGSIRKISKVTGVSSSTQPTNGTKIIAKSVTSGGTASLLNKEGISPELEFNGQIVMYKGQNCYSYGSSAQYTALAKEYKNISCIIVEDGVSPIAPKKIEEPGTNIIILDGESEIPDPIGTVSQETVVVGGSSGGTGVIYRMIDEWGNDCPYDFKNIMFTDNSTNYYTFDVLVDSVHNDFSVVQTSKNCYGNTIKSFINKFGSSYKYSLSRNIFKNRESSSVCYSNTFENRCYGNTFGDNCYGNTFGDNCSNNTLGNSCSNNTFENGYGGNTFGNDCYGNTFGYGCSGNTFGYDCSNNTFRNYCRQNTFGNGCHNNTFGNGCYQNSFGNGCISNTFGNNFKTNSFGNYCQYLTVFENVRYCNVTGGTSSAPVKNAQILNSTQGTSSNNKLTITFTADQNYTQVAGLVNGTTLRIWIAEDTVTGPQTAVSGNIPVFSGTGSNSGKQIIDSGVSVSDLSPDLVIPVNYIELVVLKMGGNLVPGMQYRITDYTCTTTQTDTQSAGHVFDIIVTADSENELNENARAAHHSGDTYFTNCDLDSWELKYCLENDANRFTWADSTNGKGVIYWMKDEFGNECPYDFKNIQFKRKLTNGALDQSGTDTFVYTFTAYDAPNGEYLDASVISFSSLIDDSTNQCYGNRIGVYSEEYSSDTDWFELNDIVFLNVFDAENDSYFHCNSNTFGESCYQNSFGDNCQNNTFGNGCYQNSFGDNCQNNTFGNGCYQNSFGNYCGDNSFGSNCQNNTFGNSCYINTFGNGCRQNSFGNYCQYNSFGNYCQRNTFGNYCRQITVFSGVKYCQITGGTSSVNYVQNAEILEGTSGTSSSSKLTITFAKNKSYTQIAALRDGTGTPTQRLVIWDATVQADWDQTTTTAKDYIKNKPENLSDFMNDVGFITSADLPTNTSDLTNDGSDGTSTYVELDELATVATTGSYNDLLDKPTIPLGYVDGDGIDITVSNNESVISVDIDSTNANGLGFDSSSPKKLKLDLATQSTAGAMSAADKTKLDNIEDKEYYPGNNISIRDTLPYGYTRLDYVYNSSNTYQDTGFKPTSDDVELEMEYLDNSSTNYQCLLGYISGSSDQYIYGLAYFSTRPIKLYTRGTSISSGINGTSGHRFIMKGTLKNGSGSIYVKDLNTGTESSQTGTYTYVAPSYNIEIFRRRSTPSYMNSGAMVYSVCIREKGVTVLNYIPAKRNSDSVCGFWDTVSGTFVTATGGQWNAGTATSSWTKNYTISATGIPTLLSQLTNDTGFITSADLPTNTSDLTNDGSDGTSTYVELDELATVATTGDYNDLINTPTIPAAQVQSDWEDTSGMGEILHKPSFNGTVLEANDWDTALYDLPVITHDVSKTYSDYTSITGIIDSIDTPSLHTSSWINTGAHIEIPITPDLVGIEITGCSPYGYETKYAFLVEDQLQSGQTAPPIPTTITAGGTVRVSVPYGKDYIYIQTNNGTYHTRPTSIKLIMLNQEDSGYVHIAGSEIITGQKTFTSDVVLWNGSQSYSGPTPYLEFRKGTSDDNKYPDWKIRGDGTGTGSLSFYSSISGADTKQVEFDARGSVTITGAKNITSLRIGHGNVAVDKGSITADKDITATHGSVTAGVDVTATGNITATTGNITATAGDVIAGGNGRFKGLMNDSNSGTGTGHYIMSYQYHSLTDSTNGATYRNQDTMPVTSKNVVNYVEDYVTTAIGNIPSTYYWANQSVQSLGSYITTPEFKQVTINGSTTDAQSTDHCVLVYDTTNKCLKFTF